MRHQERSLVFLIASLLGLASCAPAPLLSVAEPARWDGPEIFTRPRYKITPTSTVTTQSVCVDAEGTHRTTTRLIGSAFDPATGLTEVRLEIDGKPAGRLFFDDTGRLVHQQDVAALLQAPLMAASALDIGNGPLQRGHGEAVSLPGDRLFPPALLQQLKAAGATLRFGPVQGTVTYLGHAPFDGVVAAGYRSRFDAHATMTIVVPTPPGTTSVDGTLDVHVDAFAYSEAKTGLPLYAEMTTRGSFSVPAAVVAQDVRSDCRQTLDRAASTGL